MATEEIASVLSGLGERNQRAMQLRFGLAGEPPMTRVAIAAILGVTPARIGQIEDKLIRVCSSRVHRAYKAGTDA